MHGGQILAVQGMRETIGDRVTYFAEGFADLSPVDRGDGGAGALEGGGKPGAVGLGGIEPGVLGEEIRVFFPGVCVGIWREGVW